jgi:hypothetical protein
MDSGLQSCMNESFQDGDGITPAIVLPKLILMSSHDRAWHNRRFL